MNTSQADDADGHDFVSLSIPGSAEGIRKVTAALDDFTGSHGISRDLAHAAQVALDEVLSNTVRSGFGRGHDGHIEVRFELAGDILDLLVVDDGIPFDPLARADPDTLASLEERPVGGLGIYLVRKLMDSVEYEHRDGRNRLRLRKRIIRG